MAAPNVTFVSEALESKFEAIRISLRAKAEGFEADPHRADFGRYERYALKRAQPFYWDHQITSTVLSSSADLPQDTAISLARYSENHSGWFYYDREMSIDGLPPFRALLWIVATVADDKTDKARSVAVTTYGRHPDGSDFQAIHTLHLRELTTIASVMSETSDAIDPEDAGMGKYFGETPLTRGGFGGNLLRFFVASLLWIDQEIVIARSEQPNRAAMKRLTRAGFADDASFGINVVELRRKRYGDDGIAGGDSADVEWSCQWIVRGHWRQQYYQKTGERRPLWILPYVKGPEDKPLKVPSATVYAVNR